MRKILILTALTVSVVVLGYGISYAQEPLNEEEPRPVPIEDNNILPPPREEFDMKQGPVGMPPSEFNKHKKGPIHEHIKGPRPSKAEMEAKKAEFEKRLNLTEKQKKQIEANRKKDHEKVKPIFDQMRDKKHELRRLERDSSISQKDKAKKIDKLNSEIKLLNEKADKYRQENMKNFESILTDEQKKEFMKIKEEQKKEMERRRLHFENRKNMGMKPIPPQHQD